MNEQKKLKVGFDLDGVILYNPARIARPLISTVKRDLFHKKTTRFYIPTKPHEIFIWRVLHWSSIFISPGYGDLKRLVKTGRIEAHLITGRFDFLKADLDRWLKLMKARDVFSTITYNENNEQPHLYKERIIKKLDLDIFIEDNWDIVNYLTSRKNNDVLSTKIYWISNLIDYRINYSHKYPILKKALEAIIRES